MTHREFLGNSVILYLYRMKVGLLEHITFSSFFDEHTEKNSELFCKEYVHFCDFQKKGPRPKWTIYKNESAKIRNVVSVGNFGILSVARLHAYTPAYIEA